MREFTKQPKAVHGRDNGEERERQKPSLDVQDTASDLVPVEPLLVNRCPVVGQLGSVSAQAFSRIYPLLRSKEGRRVDVGAEKEVGADRDDDRCGRGCQANSRSDGFWYTDS